MNATERLGRLVQLAADWTCEHHDLCHAAVTVDGLAVEYRHWHECPLADDEQPANLTVTELRPADTIDLRAGRTIELRRDDEQGRGR